MELQLAAIDMHTKLRLLLVFLFILTTLGLFSVLAPMQDIDADGSSDSLVTEGSLAAPVASPFIHLPYLSTRFVSVLLVSPWLLSFLLILPPITTLELRHPCRDDRPIAPFRSVLPERKDEDIFSYGHPKRRFS